MFTRGNRKLKITVDPLKILICFLALLAIVFYCSGGLSVYRESKDNVTEISGSVEKLLALSKRDMPVLEEETAPLSADPVDIDAIRLELLSHYGDYDYNSEKFRSWFENAVIVGDSMAEAIKGFEWINDTSIQSEIGISLYSCEDVIAGTEWLQPKVVFLTFSANNIAAYTEYINTYISDYSDLIERLKVSIPEASIYVQAILQCDQEYLEDYPYYEYLGEYNLRMEKMCEELGVHFFDMNFICDAYPDIFQEDGLHPAWMFYPLWLTYMAEISGLAG